MARVTTPESFTASHHAAVTHTTAMIADEAITKEKIKAAAGIEYSKLALTGLIRDADIKSDAAIAWAKLSKVESDLADLAARAHASLTGVTADLHHAQNHATDHRAAGTDTIEDALSLLAIPSPLTGKVITDITQGTHADRPAAGNLGKIYAETDTKKLFWDDGTEWQDCKPAPVFDDFETDPEVDMNGWAYSKVDAGDKISLVRSNARASISHGTYCWKLGHSRPTSAGDYSQIVKEFDLSGWNELWLGFELYGSSAGTNATAELFVGGVSKWSRQITGTGPTVCHVVTDISGESGMTEIKIKFTSNVPECTESCYVDSLLLITL